MLHNVPLDKTYDHTIYFTNANDQANYFASLSKYSYSAYSYVRQDRGIKVQANAGENLYDCNYLMFKNTSFENKWFYAFVTHVEYINNLTWLVDFELDVMQTWFFDYELENCFVEREHSATDEIGENLVPEDIETGDYISDGIEYCKATDSTGDSYLRNLSLVFGCTFDNNYADFHGGYYAGLYSGLYYKVFNIPTDGTQVAQFVTDVNAFISGATGAGKPQGIITAFVCPTVLVTPANASSVTQQFLKQNTFTNIDGYIPKNKKLYTYPFNFMYVTNFQGQSAVYRYEYFADPLNTLFQLNGNFTPDPTVILSPINYKGAGASPNFDEKLTLMGYPQLPYATDVYEAWLAQSSGATLTNLLSDIGTKVIAGAVAGSVIPGAGTAVGATAGTVFGVASSVAKYYSELYQVSIKPPHANSGAGSQALASVRLLDFGFMRKHVRAEFAKIADDFFSMYGYATKRCKVPNRAVRPHWTFTKTIGCCAKGSVPADDMRAICQIYDKGITFWRDGSEVGNYNLNNTPITP